MEPIKISIEVSLSQRTMDFLRMFTPDMPQDVFDGTRRTAPVKPAEKPADEPEPQTAPEPVHEPEGPQAPPEAPAPAKEPETVAFPSAEDVREAMYAVRSRIEGEDWQENKTSENYKKFHKPLTDLFKACAKDASHGETEKPSTLKPEQRQAFVDWCARITVENGNIVDLPF